MSNKEGTPLTQGGTQGGNDPRAKRQAESDACVARQEAYLAFKKECSVCSPHLAIFGVRPTDALIVERGGVRKRFVVEGIPKASTDEHPLLGCIDKGFVPTMLMPQEVVAARDAHHCGHTKGSISMWSSASGCEKQPDLASIGQ